MCMFRYILVGECPCSAEKGGEGGREWKKRKHLGENLSRKEKVRDIIKKRQRYTKVIIFE